MLHLHMESASGPLLPLQITFGSAAQLLQTGHSCTVQHFHRGIDCRAGLSGRLHRAFEWPLRITALVLCLASQRDIERTLRPRN